MKNADSPAMPHVAKCSLTTVADDAIGVTPIMEFSGLTKREMMAMHILSGLLSDYEFDVTRQMAAEIAVQQADALLAELEKSQ